MIASCYESLISLIVIALSATITLSVYALMGDVQWAPFIGEYSGDAFAQRLPLASSWMIVGGFSVGVIAKSISFLMEKGVLPDPSMTEAQFRKLIQLLALISLMTVLVTSILIFNLES